MRSPSSSPGPRKPSARERFALSKEALKISGMPWRAASSWVMRAQSIDVLRRSMTLSPEIRARRSLAERNVGDLHGVLLGPTCLRAGAGSR
jgi:hypothetical protein